MGLGPYTAPRAPDITFVTVALWGLTALAAGGCVDLAHDKSEVMVSSGSVFEASVRPAGVLEPRWGECWGTICAHQGSSRGNTSRRRKVLPSNQAISRQSSSHRVSPVSFDT